MNTQEAVEFLRKRIISDIASYGELLEQTTFMDNTGVLVIVHTNDDKFRVAKVVAYENRRHGAQISMMFKDFNVLDDAETLYLEVLELNGFLAFGDELTINKSGKTIKSIS